MNQSWRNKPTNDPGSVRTGPLPQTKCATISLFAEHQDINYIHRCECSGKSKVTPALYVRLCHILALSVSLESNSWVNGSLENRSPI